MSLKRMLGLAHGQVRRIVNQPEVYHEGPDTSTMGGNFTPIPDVILDELLPDLSGAELKVLLYIIRRTYGFQKIADAISVSQMAEGIKKLDGTILDRGTGLSRISVIRAVGQLVGRGLIIKVRNYDERRGDMANSYTMTLPQPCLGDDSKGESKNVTPRVQKVYPQKRAGQKRDNSVRHSVRVEKDSTLYSQPKKLGKPTATSPATLLSRETDPTQKWPERSAPGIEATDSALVRIQKLGRLPNGKEFVSYLYANVSEKWRSELDAIADKIGRNWKRLLRKHDLTFEEAAEVMEYTAEDWYSPQEAVRNLVDEGVLDAAKFADILRDLRDEEPVEPEETSEDCYNWFFGEAESGSQAPRDTDEGSITEQQPGAPENAGEHEQGDAIAAAIDQLLTEDTATGYLARAFVEEDRSRIRPVTREDVKEALSRELDLDALGLTASLAAMLVIAQARRREAQTLEREMEAVAM